MKRFFENVRKKIDSKYVELSKKQVSQPNVSWKHIWSLDETRSALYKSVFGEIPNEILIHIFKYLSVPDLCKVSFVCRRFKMIVDQDEIWKFKSDTSTKLYAKSFKQVYMDWIYMKYLRNVQVQTRNSSYATSCVIDNNPPLYRARINGKHIIQGLAGFPKHPNSSAYTTVELSVGMEKTARQLLLLLEKTSKFPPEWQQSVILKQMITRYYRFMQLKSSHSSDILLIPTLDIELVWQTHLLRPDMYQSDCLRLFRRIIDHSLLFSDLQQFSKEEAFRDTCHLYEKRFQEEYCSFSSGVVQKNKTRLEFHQYLFHSDGDINASYPYWDNTHFKFSSQLSQIYENPFSFTEADIIIDAQWLHLFKNFMLNTMKNAPFNRTSDYGLSVIDLRRRGISLLTKSYERFLYMAAKYPIENDKGFILPTYAIDIMWHSHMQEPLNYIADCNRLIGYVLYHSPWTIMEDEKMNKARNQSDQIWKDEFQNDIITDHLYYTHPYTDY